MFGLLKRKNGRDKSDLSPRRSSDHTDAEVAVLNALHLAARRSSPHKAATRANIARAIGTIEAAMLGLCQIKDLIYEAQKLSIAGLALQDADQRTLLAMRYGEVITELNAIASATGHGGVHLINDSTDVAEVCLTSPGECIHIQLPHINLTAGPRGLSLPKPSRAFTSLQDLENLSKHLTLVAERLDKSAEIFRQQGAELSKRLALILEGTIPAETELKGIPQKHDTSKVA